MRNKSEIIIVSEPMKIFIKVALGYFLFEELESQLTGHNLMHFEAKNIVFWKLIIS